MPQYCTALPEAGSRILQPVRHPPWATLIDNQLNAHPFYRTCRIATIKEKGMQFVYDLGKQNLRDLKQMIEVGITSTMTLVQSLTVEAKLLSGTKRTSKSYPPTTAG